MGRGEVIWSMTEGLFLDIEKKQEQLLIVTEGPAELLNINCLQSEQLSQEHGQVRGAGSDEQLTSNSDYSGNELLVTRTLFTAAHHKSWSNTRTDSNKPNRTRQMTQF